MKHNTNARSHTDTYADGLRRIDENEKRHVALTNDKTKDDEATEERRHTRSDRERDMAMAMAKRRLWWFLRLRHTIHRDEADRKENYAHRII